MMTLTTFSEKQTDSKAYVYWRVGTKRGGILDVTLGLEHSDSALIAELYAIQHLLFVELVFGREPGSGNGYCLTVSKGAIKKLALGRSDKKYAYKYSVFLRNRMAGVTIEVSQSKDFLPVLNDSLTEVLTVDSTDIASEVHSINTPTMGQLKITKHAVEQYVSRLSSGKPKNPWLSLVKRLQHPRLCRSLLTDKVRQHKVRKYGTADNIEEWRHPDDEFRFLVLKDGDTRTLVTSYPRC
ncbi:hypothetical protein V9789_002750 [Vibrio vulnificus]|uniref:hypothetical protein n=1 Tax=Vibrio vulnificus TaxID=672 RepID=UPI0002F1A5BE|nr:hypothetical protein [Vibrio vulnificus]EGQ7833876.1 hypothetical protein [Vibrio vulnificus]EGQ8072461.1 hypothetical protein [Vibrio vulnificus]EHK8976037.1 hypothetical protein [Vibrio vulnificus]EHK9004140.1 hypothetical protein [Vibrio vulnificus]EHK9053369.1 hypothetical protein [Vibrio vulnificus]